MSKARRAGQRPAVKSGDWVTLPDREIRWKVQIVHRDGTASLLAGWKLTPDGKDVALKLGGYLGDQLILRRVPIADLIPWDYDQSFNMSDLALPFAEIGSGEVQAIGQRIARGTDLSADEREIFDMLGDD